MSRVNLVLQGGGVKGIAYVGALQAFESSPRVRHIQIQAVGGSSAGAIVAALYAAGYSADELRAELFKSPLKSLVKRSWRPSAWELVRSKGIYSTRPIYDWLYALLKRKGVETSQQLRIPCRILAADVTHRRYCTFRENQDYPVAKAVLRSLSIPIFFQPYVDGRDLYVDGGMLSNFPLWMFEESDSPTVGLRLDGGVVADFSSIGPDSGIIQYLSSLVSTMIEAHDAAGRGSPPTCVQVPIDTLGVTTADFEISNERMDQLRQSGFDAIDAFDWSKLPIPPSIAFRDKRAAEILESTSNALQVLFDRARNSALRQREYDRCEVTFRIFADGSGLIEDRVGLVNHGPSALSMLSYAVAYPREIDFSLLDLEVEVSCQQPEHEVVWLPYKNTRTEKGFLVAFVPPIDPGERRDLIVRRRLPQGFVDYAAGRIDEVGLDQKHERGIHRATLSVDIDPGLRPARIVHLGGNAVPVTGSRKADAPSHHLRWDFGAAPAGELTFSAKIQGI
jgi:NTE family protein